MIEMLQSFLYVLYQAEPPMIILINLMLAQLCKIVLQLNIFQGQPASEVILEDRVSLTPMRDFTEEGLEEQRLKAKERLLSYGKHGPELYYKLVIDWWGW